MGCVTDAAAGVWGVGVLAHNVCYVINGESVRLLFGREVAW